MSIQSQTTGFRIRPATAADVPTIVSLVKDLAEYERLSREVTASEADFARFGFGDTAYYQALLAETPAGTAVGFALYFFTFSTFLGHPTLYLEDLFVLPEWRQRGIGKALLQELAGIALKRDCGRMEWAVLNWNQPAIDFYHSIHAAPLKEWTTYRLTGKALQQLWEGRAGK